MEKLHVVSDSFVVLYSSMSLATVILRVEE